jgi:hypothetical protein
MLRSNIASAHPLHPLWKPAAAAAVKQPRRIVNDMNAPRRRPIQSLRLALALAAGLALAAQPRELLSMRPPAGTVLPAAPAAGLPDFPFPASLAGPAPTAATHETNAVRLPVVPHAVRLTVDKAAQHPLDHPLPVRRESRLPGAAAGIRTERVFAVNEPTAAPVAPVEPIEPVASMAAPPRAVRPAAQHAPAPASSQTPPPEPSRTASPARAAEASLARTRLLVVGDSLSIALADVLERRLARTPGLAFARLGKVSSGLARPDFFDWEKHMDEMAAKTAPDIVVVMIGANDNKSLRLPSGQAVHFGARDWAAEYRRRAARLVEIARRHNPAARIVWLGAPVMGDPALARDMPAVNAALADAMRRLPGCRFVDMWPVLAGPNGAYAEFLDQKTRLRAPDGVHLAPAGAARLADACMVALAEPATGILLSQAP